MTGYVSNLITHDIGSLGCPLSLSYRLTHGPSAGTGEARFRIERNPNNAASQYMGTAFPLGGTCHIQCDASHFYGYIVGGEETADDSSGDETLVISMVDWRDRLHDKLFFSAINILESDGSCWHILPDDWSTQDVTSVTRELEEKDFTAIQYDNPLITPLFNTARVTLITSATLLNTISTLGMFTWQANVELLLLLSKTRPMNLDWRDGVTYADAIEDILSRSNLQWTISGPNTIVITRTGCACNPDAVDFLEGNATMCDKFDGWSSSRGKQLDESGTLIRIVGDKDKYQLTYPCRPDWNILFDFRMCFDSYTLQLILKKNGLLMTSKLSQLPVAYHDDTPIESPAVLGQVGGRKTRNDLTIEEYVNDICFKTYIVDSWNASKQFIINAPVFEAIGTYEPFWNDVVDFPTAIGGGADETPLSSYDWEGKIEREEAAFHHKISSNLVTETAHRMIVHRTAYILSKKKNSPLEKQHYLSPGNQGATLDVDEVISKVKSKVIYIARIKFTEPVFYIADLEDWESPDKVKPDRILVTLSFDWKIYQKLYGSLGGGFRSRERKHSVSKLHRAYVDGGEVFVMAQSVKIRVNENGQVPAVNPVKADDISDSIANAMLNTELFKRSGSVVRKHMASFNVDGTITSINVSFDGNNAGLSESIEFGGTQNFITRNAIPPSIYRVGRVIPTTAKVNRERIEEQAIAIMTEAMLLPKSISSRKSLAGSLKAATNIRFMSEFWRGVNAPEDISADFTIKPSDATFKGSERGGVVIVEETP